MVETKKVGQDLHSLNAYVMALPDQSFVRNLRET